MTTSERLEHWKQSGIISDTEHNALSALVRKERFSVFLELNALLYLGVLSLVAGMAWTFSTHFERLGDAFILGVLSTIFGGSLYYCFSRATSYANHEVESPNLVFDYVLYLACLVLSVELGYIEFRFEWLRDAWHNYLLFSSLVFFVFAYRFDNRFVLSLALSSLAGWFGLQVSRFGYMSSEDLRVSALAYASIVTISAVFLYRQEIKRHFLETYLHIATTVAFIALVSGEYGNNRLMFLMGLAALSTASVVLGLRFNRFAFVVYGIIFGYIGISIEALRSIHGDSPVLMYLVATGSMVIVLVVFLSRRFGRQE